MTHIRKLELMELGVYALAGFAAVLLVTILLPSCGPLADPGVARYAALQADCIDHAKTRQEADNCRDAVKAAYGRFDAGTKDAAHE